jgi:F0F1-type ATP synthase epsilon subunit
MAKLEQPPDPKAVAITPKKKKSGPKEGDTFHLKVYSPFQVYYEGNVESASAINDTGPFDVLAGHHNFITLLNPCDLVIRVDQKDDEILKISRGIMKIQADDVVVFLDV